MARLPRETESCVPQPLLVPRLVVVRDCCLRGQHCLAPAGATVSAGGVPTLRDMRQVSPRVRSRACHNLKVKARRWSSHLATATICLRNDLAISGCRLIKSPMESLPGRVYTKRSLCDVPDTNVE